MKKMFLSILFIFIMILVFSCTNDEGEQDVEILTPDEETQKVD